MDTIEQADGGGTPAAPTSRRVAAAGRDGEPARSPAARRQRAAPATAGNGRAATTRVATTSAATTSAATTRARKAPVKPASGSATATAPTRRTRSRTAPAGAATSDAPSADGPTVEVAGREVPVNLLVSEHELLRKELASLKRAERRRVRALRDEDALKPYQVELLKLQRHLEDHRKRMIVLFEGRDAAGKGGTIRRVTRFMNEKHYRVVALGRPTEEQRTQWYFQRYVERFPTGGEMVLFDRSWYNRAMVEQVFGFCTEEEYQHFMHGVVGFEKDLVRQGTVLVKLYFSVTKEEQKRRFDRRRNDPLRQWKLSEIDMQAQEHWDDFTEMKYRMLRRTSVSESPWVIIRSENKHQARLNAMRVILNAVPYEGRDPKVDFVPDPEIVLSGAQEIQRMEAERIRGGKFAG
jgi:polyphosphate kinase 2